MIRRADGHRVDALVGEQLAEILLHTAESGFDAAVVLVLALIAAHAAFG